MDHIPFVADPAFTNTIWALIIGGGVLGFAGIVPLAYRKTRRTRDTVLYSLLAGAGFVLLSIAAFSLTHSPASTKNLAVEWQEQVAEQLTDRYDTKVTPENVASLEYPEVAPAGRVTLGTATLSSGREVALVFNDGRAYLRIIGEELPFD